ncbi:MAG: NAD-dependent epimerase/dehydratase family protein, partial [Vicinamibacterales bacterium]
MSRPVLVTGASGFAGGHFLDLLSQTDTGVVAWHQPGGQPLQTPRTEWAAVDVLDRAAVRAAVQRARPIEVYHFAGAAHVGNAWSDSTSTFEVNVLGTYHLMDALRDAAPDASVLLPSSALVYESSGRHLRE